LRRKKEKKREGKEREKEGREDERKEESQIEIPKEKSKLQKTKTTKTKSSCFFFLPSSFVFETKLHSVLKNAKSAIKKGVGWGEEIN
jgi:hypothetical protein